MMLSKIEQAKTMFHETLAEYRCTVNFQTKHLYNWSLGQTNSYIKEVGFLSAPSNCLAQ